MLPFLEAHDIPLEQVGCLVSDHHFIYEEAKRGYS